MTQDIHTLYKRKYDEDAPERPRFSIRPMGVLLGATGACMALLALIDGKIRIRGR